jgi:hypothetical protein
MTRLTLFPLYGIVAVSPLLQPNPPGTEAKCDEEIMKFS